MRRFLIFIGLFAVIAIADATPAKKDHVAPPDDQQRNANAPAKPIDITSMLDKLDVYRDETGQFYTSPRHDAIENWGDAGVWLFVGDGKKMYQQRVFGSSWSADKGTEWHVWAPRAKHANGATIELGQLLVYCRNSADKTGRKKLVQLKADEAKAMLTHATFLPTLWQRQGHRLARDDDAVYYYIDRLRDEFGGNGFRIFIGPAGDLKPQQMTNIAHDSAGEIFATKGGQMKIVFKSHQEEPNEGVWMRGGKRVQLTMLPVEDNVYLIYRDFGLYGALGTPCDDM